MERKFVVALSLSIGLHLALAVVLLSGDFSAPLKSTPKATAVEMKPIQAVVVDSSKLQAHINKLKNIYSIKVICTYKYCKHYT